MKIKAWAAIIILGTALAARVHAFGLGAQFNLSAGKTFAPGAAALISPSDRTHIAFNWYLDPDGYENTFGLAMDVCPLTLPITSFGAGTFNFTLGVGIFTNTVFSNIDNDLNMGLRVPIGLNIMLGEKTFEIFFHVAPSFGIDLRPSLGFSDPFYPIAIGARFWIRGAGNVGRYARPFSSPI